MTTEPQWQFVGSVGGIADQGVLEAVSFGRQPSDDDQLAGRTGVAERPVLPMNPGNAGGGKGPQFKTNARRGEGPGDWAT